MNRAITVIWSAMLVVTTVGVVPVVVSLLQRGLTAARNIERYTEEALASGVEIAEHTGAVAELQTTIGVAGELLQGASAIEGHAAAIGAALTAAMPDQAEEQFA